MRRIGCSSTASPARLRCSALEVHDERLESAELLSARPFQLHRGNEVRNAEADVIILHRCRRVLHPVMLIRLNGC